MSALALTLQKAFPPVTCRTLWQLVDLYLEMMGFYILTLGDSDGIGPIGEAIMKDRLSDKFWIRYTPHGHILYEKNRTDIVFQNDGFTIKPGNPLYAAITETGFPIVDKLLKCDKVKCQQNKDGYITVWVEKDGQRISNDYDYRFLANDILPPFIKHTYPEKIQRIIDGARK